MLRAWLIAAVLVTVAAGDDSAPFIRLEYSAADGMSPAAPVAGWWAETVAGADGWWRERVGARPPEPPAALVVIGSGMQVADHRAVPVVAAHWTGAIDPAMASAVADQVAAWRAGYAVTVTDRGVALAHDRLAAPAPGVIAPGWLVEIDLRRLPIHALVSDALVPNANARRDPHHAVLSAIVAQLAARSIRAGVAPGGRGWIEPGIAGDWLAPIDARLFAQLPDDVALAAAIGVDGDRLAAIVAAIPGIDLIGDALATALEVDLELDPRQLARGCGGTWMLMMLDERRGILRVPRSSTSDALVASLVHDDGEVLPPDGRAIVLGGGAVARDEDAWLVADSIERIDDWRRLRTSAPTLTQLGGRPAPGTAAWLAVAAKPLAQWSAATLAPEMLEAMPVPTTPDNWHAILTQAGVAARAPSWTIRCAQLAEAGPSTISAMPGAGPLRLELDGPVLPWLVPGAALGWLVAPLQDRAGIARLERVRASLRARGIAVSPEELMATLPAGDAASDDALLQRVNAWSRPTSRRRTDLWKRFGALGGPLPADEGDDGTRDLLAALAVETADLDRMSHDAVALALLRASGRAGGPDPWRWRGLVTAARVIGLAGRDLIVLGDRDGLVLVDRSLRLTRSPQSIGEALAGDWCAAQRDDAWLAAGLLGLVDRRRLDAWAGETPSAWPASAWRGEVAICVGWLADVWQSGHLPGPQRPPFALFQRQGAGIARQVDRDLDRARPALDCPRLQMAGSADDHATLMEALIAAADGADIDQAIAGLSSPSTLQAIPVASALRRARQLVHLRHRLMRLAWRLHAAAPLVPAATQAAAELLVGPLVIAADGLVVRLRYEAVPGGFALVPDAQARPAGLSDQAWIELQGQAPGAERRLMLPGYPVRSLRMLMPVPVAPLGAG